MKKTIFNAIWVAILTLVENIKDRVVVFEFTQDILEGHSLSIDLLNSEEDKRIIIGIVDTVKNYSFSQEEKEMVLYKLLDAVFDLLKYHEIVWNKSLKYIDRERANYLMILQEVYIKVLLYYLVEEVDIIDEYEKFKSEFKDYGKWYGKIAALLEKGTDVSAIIEKRIQDSTNLLNKYRILGINESILKSIYEQEYIYNKAS